MNSSDKLMKDTRPWGSWEILLEEPYCKVKRIVVKPGSRLSYQWHHKRAECWTIVQGSGLLTLDDVKKEYKSGAIIYIPTKAKHRIENTGSEALILIEVQVGSYFGEDDIERIEDDYRRT